MLLARGNRCLQTSDDTHDDSLWQSPGLPCEGRNHHIERRHHLGSETFPQVGHSALLADLPCLDIEVEAPQDP